MDLVWFNCKSLNELWFGHTSAVKYFRIFGSELESFILDMMKGIFIGYSNERKAYRYYNKRLQRIVGSVNVKVNEQYRGQIKTYGRELEVEMIITDLVSPELE